MRRILSIFVCLLVLSVTHTQSFLATWVRPSSVVLFWDESDHDEDVFIRTALTIDHKAVLIEHKEESREDFGRKLIGSMKSRFEYVITSLSTLQVSQTGCIKGRHLIIEIVGISRRVDHPPNVGSV